MASASCLALSGMAGSVSLQPAFDASALRGSLRMSMKPGVGGSRGISLKIIPVHQRRELCRSLDTRIHENGDLLPVASVFNCEEDACNHAHGIASNIPAIASRC